MHLHCMRSNTSLIGCFISGSDEYDSMACLANRNLLFALLKINPYTAQTWAFVLVFFEDGVY